MSVPLPCLRSQLEQRSSGRRLTGVLPPSQRWMLSMSQTGFMNTSQCVMPLRPDTCPKSG